jgi:hypothetical protein
MSRKVHLSNGDVILFSGGIAVVRFFGKVKFGRGDWVGLELSGPMGDCDGSKNSVRYYKCNKGHGKFIRLSDVKRKITAEELLLKLNSEVEKNPKGKLSLKEKKDLERQISDLAAALNRQQVANSDLEKELYRTKERNRTLVEQSQFDGKSIPNNIGRAQSEPINGTYSRPLEKGLHLCFKHAHELLIDIRKVIDSNVIRQEELAERIDDKLHLMLMQLIRTHTSLEEMGLVTRVDPGAASINSSGFEPVVTNKNRPPISTLFSNITQKDNPKPPELTEH